ncbi:hypothetical protein ACFQ4K_09915 [Tistrella bauzanensis]
MRTIKFETIAGDLQDVSGDLLEPAGRGFAGSNRHLPPIRA